MKKGYKKLLIFELIIFIILMLNSFVWNILDSYYLIIFLILILLSFKKIFGTEKDNHRYTKDVIFEIIIFLLIFFLLYYLSGILIGFAKIDNYYNLNGIVKFIIPITITIVLKEYFRYQAIMKSEGNKLLTILTCLLLVCFDISNVIYYNDFSTKYEMFKFIAISLLPSLSTNIVCSYLTYKIGYKPNIVYLLIITLYQYLIPIVPNPSEYILSIIKLLTPVIMIGQLNKFFYKSMDDEVKREYKKNKILPLIVPVIIVITLVYFTSGYFKYYAIAIASGSMEKTISKGDVVIVEKIENDNSKLKEGTIIAYKYDGIIVVHRIAKIINEKDKLYIYTKGDANKTLDNYVVEENSVIGIVNVKIPFVGLPTVWLNEI